MPASLTISSVLACLYPLMANTFKDAFENRDEPLKLLFHTDQGAEFTSHMFIESLKAYGIKQSFSYPGCPNDNACMEGFYSILRRVKTM